jgi:hypothetical protein
VPASVAGSTIIQHCPTSVRLSEDTTTTTDNDPLPAQMGLERDARLSGVADGNMLFCDGDGGGGEKGYEMGMSSVGGEVGERWRD